MNTALCGQMESIRNRPNLLTCPVQIGAISRGSFGVQLPCLSPAIRGKPVRPSSIHLTISTEINQELATETVNFVSSQFIQISVETN